MLIGAAAVDQAREQVLSELAIAQPPHTPAISSGSTHAHAAPAVQLALCSEEKPHHCHRGLVAEYFKENGGMCSLSTSPRLLDSSKAHILNEWLLPRDSIKSLRLHTEVQA
jgi:hypothetical protein